MIRPLAMSALAAAALLLSHSVLLADVVVFGSGSNSFSMDFTPIGNAGNVADLVGGLPAAAGSVNYSFRMGTYEVSRDMITKANSAGSLGVSLTDMSSHGGNGVNRPATGISWNEAARFVNWLNTSQGFQAAYKFATQPGQGGYDVQSNILLWQSGDAGYNAANPYRNSLARYFLPSADEWYKAAYYDPNANGGTGGYFDYPNGANSPPTAAASGTSAGTAVYNQPFSQGPSDITQAGGGSPYGVVGLGGSALEWMESDFDMVNDNPAAVRGLRGGDWGSDATYLNAGVWLNNGPAAEGLQYGFRVAAAVPEASSLLCCGAVGLLACAWRYVRGRGLAAVASLAGRPGAGAPLALVE